jgi:sugar phosphate isomerase/epimerase
MTWHIGASTGCCPNTPIIEVIESLAEIGTPAIELGTPPAHFDMWQRGQVDDVKRTLCRTGMKAVAIHAPFGGLLDLSDATPQHRSAGMGGVMLAAAVLRELGGRIVVVHATDVSADVADLEPRIQRACEALRALQMACRAMRMTVALESPLPHLIGGTPQQFERFLHAAGPETRVCLDTGHLALGQRWDAFLDLAGDRVVHVHAHDNCGLRDDHGIPGEGRIDWRHIAHTLHRVHYRGWLMLELACPREPLPDYFRRGAAQLRQALCR